MRRIAIVGAALLLAANSAAGACHKYSIWKYPWPQRCRYTAYAPAPLVHRADEQTHDWAVEITKLPPSWDLDEHIEVTVPEKDPERLKGLNKLKEQLK